MGVNFQQAPLANSIHYFDFHEGFELEYFVIKDTCEDTGEVLNSLNELRLSVGQVNLELLIHLQIKTLFFEAYKWLKEEFEEAIVEVGIIPLLDHVGEEFLLELHKDYYSYLYDSNDT
jgi:hypothetical protein